MNLWDQIEGFARDEALQIALVLLGTLLAVRLVRFIIGRVERRMSAKAAADPLVPTEEAKRRDAILGVATYLGVFLAWVVGGFMVLQRLGINTGPLVASAGVAGLAIGFGAQSFVRDVVTGFFVLAENQYGVGDVIEVNAPGGLVGTVERVTLRTTVLRAVTGDAHIVPNGEIRSVTNKTKEWSRAVVDVAVPYASDLTAVLEALAFASSSLADDAELAPFLLEAPEVWGIEALDDTLVRVRVVAKTLPMKQWEVGRRLRRAVLGELKKRDLTLPVAVPYATLGGQPSGGDAPRRARRGSS